MSRSREKKRGDSSAATKLGDLNRGDTATLVHDTLYGGTMQGLTHPAGTRIKVAWYYGDEAVSCDAWDPWEERWLEPRPIASNTEVCDVAPRVGPAVAREPTGHGKEDFLDPLQRETKAIG